MQYILSHVNIDCINLCTSCFTERFFQESEVIEQSRHVFKVKISICVH